MTTPTVTPVTMNNQKPKIDYFAKAIQRYRSAKAISKNLGKPSLWRIK